MSALRVGPTRPSTDGTIVQITPKSASWRYVGFEVLALSSARRVARESGERELCVVVVAGAVHITSAYGDWRNVGTRPDPWSGHPDAAYLPPATQFAIEGATPNAEVALCWAPAPSGGARARILPHDGVKEEVRGRDSHERRVHPILMGDGEAETLLVCEVITPGGNWSSYPPHKHDRDDLPTESLLEETYYHRISPAGGFGLQRVYTDDRTLDESIVFHDRDCVLVPRGYHTVAAPPGCDIYYLNVMAGPVRAWAVATDSHHEWRALPDRHPQGSES